jgi:hypothetical protein
VTNPGGHSSVPRPTTRSTSSPRRSARLARYRFPVALNPVTRAFFEQTARVERARDGRRDARARREPGRQRGRGDAVARPALRLDAAHDVRGDAPRGGPRVQRAAADGDGERELPHRADVALEETQATLARVVADTAVRITLTLEHRETFGARAERGGAGAARRGRPTLTRRTWGRHPR